MHNLIGIEHLVGHGKESGRYYKCEIYSELTVCIRGVMEPDGYFRQSLRAV